MNLKNPAVHERHEQLEQIHGEYNGRHPSSDWMSRTNMCGQLACLRAFAWPHFVTFVFFVDEKRF
ncbi:MAG: hypothetical protein IPM27_06870 [Nitrosomonadales bacterium]|nr:hypothetical protein [Nitrosomonadales bacterium]